ncbi:MAG: aspartyl/glutamyl-tRNA amidotransferase subunit C [Patescibacteria group bacterium]
MISKDDIKGLAELARLKLKEEELDSLGKDISNILGYVGQVGSFSIDSDKIEKPLVRNILREDTPREDGHPLSGKEEHILAQLPRREGNYNVVRKIIQKDE